jgi:hypothetical protein
MAVDFGKASDRFVASSRDVSDATRPCSSLESACAAALHSASAIADTEIQAAITIRPAVAAIRFRSDVGPSLKYRSEMKPVRCCAQLQQWFRVFQTIAKQCVWLADQTFIPVTDCGKNGLPIFVTGGNVMRVTHHDLDAILGLNGDTPHLNWIKLNYDGIAKSRAWLGSDPRCAGQPVTRLACSVTSIHSTRPYKAVKTTIHLYDRFRRARTALKAGRGAVE